MGWLCVARGRFLADGGDDAEKRRQEPPPIEFLRPGELQPSPPPQQPVAWVPRPEEFQRPTYAAPPVAPPTQGRRAVLAGILLLVAGLLGFLYTFSVFMIVPTLQDFYNLTNQSATEAISNSLLSIAIIYGQALAFVGGATAVQRKNWKLALFCAGFSTFGIGLFFLGSVLSVVATLILLGARHEFAS